MSFGAVLRKKRIERHVSQQELSEMLFVTKQTISNWENNKREPSVLMLKRIGKALNISIDELLEEISEVYEE